MVAEILDKLLFDDAMLQRAPFNTLSRILSISLFYRNKDPFFKMALLPFQNTQTQGNLTKELNPNCCSSPRSMAFQTCMSRRSEEDTLKCLQKW